MNVVRCAQYSYEWWTVRRGVATASEFHRIITTCETWHVAKDGKRCGHTHRSKKGAVKCQKSFGGELVYEPWSYTPTGAQSYVCQLIADDADPNYGHAEEYVSRAMAMGSYLEPEARRFYEFSRGEKVTEVGFCTTDDGRFGCSPDGLVGDDGGIECKSPHHKTQVKWLLAGVVPPEHLAQCHGCILVTGRSYWDFLSYCPPLPELLVRVERDERTEALAKHLETFHAEYAKARAKIDWQPDPAGPPERADYTDQEIYF